MPNQSLTSRAAEPMLVIVRGIKPDQLTARTPDTEWDVRALVNHLLIWGPSLEGGARKESVAPPPLDTDYTDGAFPAVMSNSIVHHIPQPAAVFAEIVRVAAPGATLFVRDLLRPADRDELTRLVESYAGGANAHQKQMFADSLHAALTLDEVRALVASLGFGPETVRPTSDRHWTWTATKG